MNIKKIISSVGILSISLISAMNVKASGYGRIESGDVVLDMSDMAMIEEIFSTRYIESAKSAGFTDGANTVDSPSLVFTYHDHIDKNGVVHNENNYQSPTSGGCFTVYHHDPQYTWQKCGGSLIINSSPKMAWDGNQGWHQVGQNVWAECSKCGAHYDQSAYYNQQGCTGGQNVFTGYKDYYTLSCGRGAHEIISASVVFE